MASARCRSAFAAFLDACSAFVGVMGVRPKCVAAHSGATLSSLRMASQTSPGEAAPGMGPVGAGLVMCGMMAATGCRIRARA